MSIAVRMRTHDFDPRPASQQLSRDHSWSDCPDQIAHAQDNDGILQCASTSVLSGRTALPLDTGSRLESHARAPFMLSIRTHSAEPSTALAARSTGVYARLWKRGCPHEGFTLALVKHMLCVATPCRAPTPFHYFMRTGVSTLA